MMGACQDCWVTLGGEQAGRKLRACSTLLQAGMQICTTTEAVAQATATNASQVQP
jgi:NADH dehydrogenase/NADH:ubiquinone oxidoreductase subunit G